MGAINVEKEQEARFLEEQTDIIVRQLKCIAVQMLEEEIGIEYVELAEPYFTFVQKWMRENGKATAFGLCIVRAKSLRVGDVIISNANKLCVESLDTAGIDITKGGVGFVHATNGKVYEIYREELKRKQPHGYSLELMSDE